MKKKTNQKTRPGSSGSSSKSSGRSAAVAAAKALPWKSDKLNAWAQRKLAAMIKKVGNAQGLAPAVEALGLSGLEGRDLKRPYLQTLRGWKKAHKDGLIETAGKVAGDIARAAGQTASDVLDFAGSPAGQQLINAGLMAAGMPPVPWGGGATGEESLAIWGAVNSEPLPAENDPDLSEKKSGGVGGLLGTLGAGLGLLLMVKR